MTKASDLCLSLSAAGHYCTRPAGHEPDEHIAAMGPYGAPYAPVLERWPYQPCTCHQYTELGIETGRSVPCPVHSRPRG